MTHRGWRPSVIYLDDFEVGRRREAICSDGQSTVVVDAPAAMTEAAVVEAAGLMAGDGFEVVCELWYWR